tara:strand:+ start:621 stop:1268 length:648 start_codon:yes stop_codon:yes gene_type:complete
MNNDIILILGKKGSGKSFFTKKALDNFPNVIIIDVLNEYENGTIIYTSKDFVDFIKQHGNKNFRIILKELDDEKINDYFYLIKELRNVSVVAEEVDFYYPATNPNVNFVELVKYGRHYGINIIGITRRPFECSNFLRSQADLIVSFRQHEPRDIEWLMKRSPDFEKVSDLPDYEFIATGETDLLKKYWNIDYKEGKEVEEIPEETSEKDIQNSSD